MGEEFTNKDIIKMMMDFKTDIKGLQAEINETRTLLKNYNGLREKMINFELDYAKFKQEVITKNLLKTENKTDWKWIAGWIVAVGSLLLKIFA